MVEDKKSTNTHYVSLEEISRIESEIRSNLRYVWQKTVSYILSYNPTVLEIEQELYQSFLLIIQDAKVPKRKIKTLLLDAFSYVLEFLLKTKKITSQDVEEVFIEKSIENFRGHFF